MRSSPAQPGSRLSLAVQDRDRREILGALTSSPRRLPSRFFYDAHGAELFEAITRTEAYYPTRIETAILRTHARDLAAHMGPRPRIVELGSGSSTKTQILLDAVSLPATYIPIDVSGAQLRRAAARLRERYQGLNVMPVCADYTRRVILPGARPGDGRTVVFFPGSTIGNLEPVEARDFLRRLVPASESSTLLIIGVDCTKDQARLDLAYNDPEGITAEFNLNILDHVNRILSSDFDPDGFRHHAFFNSAASRVEMHLISTRAQFITIPEPPGAAWRLALCADEPIVTEHSYKYSDEEFVCLAHSAGFRPLDVFSDAQRRFAVHLFTR